MTASFRSLLPTFLCSAALLSSAIGAQFVVSSTGDSGPGSLRQAILDANDAPGTDSITFTLAPVSAGTASITVSSALPEITEALLMDGNYTTEGLSVFLVEIVANGLPGGQAIMTVGGSGSSLKNLGLGSITAGISGIVLQGTGGHTLEKITTGVFTSNQVSSSMLYGIDVSSDENSIIGCRVCEAKDGAGIRITGSRNVLKGSFLGLRQRFPFHGMNQKGIYIVGGSGNVIGGDPSSAASNQIGSNLAGGIHIQGGTGHRILGNLVTRFSGLGWPSTPIAGSYGILIDGGAANVEILGTTISRSWGPNLKISGPASNILVRGIGSSLAGEAAISVGAGVTELDIEDSNISLSAAAGISLAGSTPVSGPIRIRHNSINQNAVGIEVVSGMGQVTIGTRRDPALAFSNQITGNVTEGIVVSDPTAKVRISENAMEPTRILPSDSLTLMTAINLKPASEPAAVETPNDLTDADNGPNGLQNKPVITRIDLLGADQVKIYGTLNSKANAKYSIEAFQHNVTWSSSAPDIAGYLGSTTVTTSEDGNVTFTMEVSGYTAGRKIALTATSPEGETSEHSKSELPGFAPPQFPLLINQTSLGLAENDAATGSAFSLVRPAAVSGAFNAGFSIQASFPLDPTPGTTRQPPFKYRFNPGDPWINMNWGGSASVPFTATEVERVIYLAAFDDNSWDPTNKPGRLFVGTGYVTTSVEIALQFPDNDPPPVFTAVNHGMTEFPTSGTASYFENSTEKPYIRLIADRPSSLYLAYRVTLNDAESTAVSGLDFSTSSFPFTASIFEGGRIMIGLKIDPLDDSRVEGNEVIALNVTCTTAGIAYNSVVPLVIGDNDFYRVSVGDASVAEGNAGTSILTFPVSLPQAIPEAVTFDFTTASQTATAGVDFTAASGTFTLPANSNSGTIQVEVIGDTLIEASETLALTLSNPGRTGDLVLARATAVGTITNDDFPKISVADRSVTEEAGSISFAVRLDQPAPMAGSVAWSITGGSATFNSDYYVNTMSGTVNFAAGSSSAIIALSILRDSIPESNETIQLQLSNPVNLAMGTSVAVVTIQDDDVPILFNPSQPILLTEGDTGSQNLTITLALNSHAVRAGSVDWSVTADSTAVNAASGTVHFAVGDLTATLVLSVPGDLVPQAIRTVKLAFSNPVEVALSGQTFTVATILDNDQRVLSGSALTLNEGTGGTTAAGVEISIPAPLGVPVSVSWQTVNGSALAGSDFTSASGTTTIPAGQTSASIPLTILADSVLETTESFSITLSSPVNATLAATTCNVTITNDDAQPSLEIDASNTVTVGGSGNFRAWIEIVLPQDAVYNFPLTWRVSTRDGTALAGTHYTGISNGLLTVPASYNGFAPDPLWIAITVPGGPVNMDTARRFFVDFTPESGPATVVSAGVKIEPLRVIEFNRLLPQLYAVRFPTGKGQTYVIQEAATLAGPWVNNSSTLLGSGSPVTQTVSSATNRAYFRVRASSNPPAAPVNLGNP